ncbi:MAG TPA: zf-HC2 domain-containing protein [Kribbella sp.]
METELGPYVLGGLEPGDEERLQRHLERCAHCRQAFDEIAWIPAWLSKVPAEDLEGLLAEDDAPMVTARVARKGWLAVCAVAATVVAIALGVTSAVAPEPHPVAAGSSVQSVDQHTGVAASLAMTAQGTRTALRLRLSGVAPGEHCSLIARTTDGRTEVTATWIASYRGTADIPATTAIPTERLQGFDVINADDRILVRLAVPRHR